MPGHEGPSLGEAVCVTHQVSLPVPLMAEAAEFPGALLVRARGRVSTALVSSQGVGVGGRARSSEEEEAKNRKGTFKKRERESLRRAWLAQLVKGLTRFWLKA